MIGLIDGDILLYRVGYTTENEPEGIAQVRMEELINRILESVKADGYHLYLSAGRTDTFRAKVNPAYKANRTQPKPLHYDFLKQYLKEAWNAEVAVEEEADDLLGIKQMGVDETFSTIICSIDKDLLQIPGHHYNFVKDEFNFVTPEQGLQFFYKQLLIGDKADNITGVTGIGPVKAGRLIDELEGEPEEVLFEVVQEKYREWLQTEWQPPHEFAWDDMNEEWGDFQEKQMNNIILINGICLKIRTKEKEVWTFPKNLDLKPEVVPTL